jgi:hypothetical protein
VAIRAAVAITENRSAIYISATCKKSLSWRILETVTSTPIASWLSTRVISWLNRLRIVPLSVEEKNDWGALIDLDPVVRARNMYSPHLITVLRRTEWSFLAVDGDIKIKIALQFEDCVKKAMKLTELWKRTKRSLHYRLSSTVIGQSIHQHTAQAGRHPFQTTT